MSKFLVIGLNPTIQNTFTLPNFHLSQVNRVSSHRVDLAGKGGNTTRVLTQLGESAVQLTYGGGRHLGLYRDLCAADAVPLRLVECDVDIRYCHTLLSQGEQTTTEIVEAGHAVSPSVEEELLQVYEAELAMAHTVVIGGSRAPGFSDGIYAQMVRMAAGAGIRTVLDIRGDDLLACLAHRPTAIKINLSEFSQTFTPETVLDEEINPDDIPGDLFEAMIRLHAQCGSEIVLTNGRRPVLFVEDGRVKNSAPLPVKAVNTVGSGDAATAGLAAGLHRGLPLVGAIRLAMECAAKNVQLEKPGSIM